MALQSSYVCAGCGYVLEFLGRPDRETGEFEVRCVMPGCSQYGETGTMRATLVKVASKNTIATWPADAP